jgi:hypothetical protein
LPREMRQMDGRMAAQCATEQFFTLNVLFISNVRAVNRIGRVLSNGMEETPEGRVAQNPGRGDIFVVGAIF